MQHFDFMEPPILTVTALNSYLRELLETDEILQDVWVRGEISNLSRPNSGHLYFTLKDSEAQVRCVMWKQSALRLRVDPADGVLVEAHGSMSVYPAQGQVQLYLDTLRPAGEGALYQEFLRLKARLESEGLFDPAHKRTLPQLPDHIGVVTSASGAALQDILNTLKRRLPAARVSVAPTLVQGTEAPAGIVRALSLLNALEDLDEIIIARGGGSIEDLWAFNDEEVARAIYHSRVPVISGIGHETDFTIADFVADLRAPTPTGAAELATPITATELKAGAQVADRDLDERIHTLLGSLRQDLTLLSVQLLRYSPAQRIANALQRQDELAERLERATRQQVSAKAQRLENSLRHLESLNPNAILRRGYAIVADQSSGKIISRVAQGFAGQPVTIRVQDGSLSGSITETHTGVEDNA